MTVLIKPRIDKNRLDQQQSSTDSEVGWLAEQLSLSSLQALTRNFVQVLSSKPLQVDCKALLSTPLVLGHNEDGTDKEQSEHGSNAPCTQLWGQGVKHHNNCYISWKGLVFGGLLAANPEFAPCCSSSGRASTHVLCQDLRKFFRLDKARFESRS